MHERSLVKSLLQQVEDIRRQHQATSVDVVTVEYGPLSGIEGELVESAFEELAGEIAGRRPELIMRNVPLRVRCRECHRESNYSVPEFSCQHCHKQSVQVIDGHEFRLIDVNLTIDAENTEDRPHCEAHAQ